MQCCHDYISKSYNIGWCHTYVFTKLLLPREHTFSRYNYTVFLLRYISAAVMMWHVTLAATTGTTILAPCHVIKSLQLIWKSSAGRPGSNIGHRDSNPSNGHQGDRPFWFNMVEPTDAFKIQMCIGSFMPYSVLILASDWLTTVEYRGVSHVWRHQREI